MGIFAGLEHIVRENEPIANFTWMRIGGAARYFAEPTSVEELQGLVARCRDANLPVRILGGGSNILIRDEGVAAMVIRLAAPEFGDISVSGNTVSAGGGAQLSHVISTAVRDGLSGLEPLVGIPGTIGGALRTNAGANGSDIGQVTRKATVMTRSGEVVVRKDTDLRFAYRQSSLDDLVILSADFGLEPEDVATLTKRMQKLWIIQKTNQPPSNLNVGWIFQDVGGISAASLIEQAGLKNAQVGQASVSDLNANFVVASPQAKSRDVLELIERLRNGVAERLGVSLETDLQVW